jgi:hypothetical protein
MLIIWCVWNSIGVLTSCSWGLSQFLHVSKWRKLRFKLIAKDSPEFLWLYGFSGIHIKPDLVAKTLDYDQQVSTNSSSVHSYKAATHKVNWEIEKPVLFYRVHQLLSPASNWHLCMILPSLPAISSLIRIKELLDRQGSSWKIPQWTDYFMASYLISFNFLKTVVIYQAQVFQFWELWCTPRAF